MPTPAVNGLASMSQRTGGLPRPYFTEALSTVRVAAIGPSLRSGVKPMSRMRIAATTNIASSSPTRTRKGAPRLLSCATTPPSTEPTSIALPLKICERPKTVSRLPLYPTALSASTSHASTAPEKKVKPSPSSTETTAHAQKGECQTHSIQYMAVVTASVIVPIRYDARLPTVSATTPVGISKTSMPAVNSAFAANASKLVSPASRRKRVLTPQMNEAASVLPSTST